MRRAVQLWHFPGGRVGVGVAALPAAPEKEGGSDEGHRADTSADTHAYGSLVRRAGLSGGLRVCLVGGGGGRSSVGDTGGRAGG